LKNCPALYIGAQKLLSPMWKCISNASPLLTVNNECPLIPRSVFPGRSPMLGLERCTGLVY